jgi:hypothetical protein
MEHRSIQGIFTLMGSAMTAQHDDTAELNRNKEIVLLHALDGSHTS